MSDTIPVRVRECPDGSHPDGDLVYLREKIDWVGGVMLRAILDEGRRTGDIRSATASWMDGVLRYGVTGWNLHDEHGETPFDIAILLADYTLAEPVGVKANELYTEQVIVPLAKALRETSPRGQTAGSTSATKTPTPLRPRRSSQRASDGRRSQARSA